MALKLDILANTRQLVSEMRGAGASIEDVGDSLDDLARDAKLAGDKSERAIDDIGDAGTQAGRDVDKAADKMERSFRDLVKDAKKADKAVEKVGDGGKKGFTKAGDAAAEFKTEALANFSEVTSSFDGSMESIVDLAQGSLGGVASALPGIGLVAGAAAAGIGAISAALSEAAERSEEIKNSIIEDFLELGTALETEAVKARVRDLLGAENTRKEAEALADIMGITVAQAALAMAGDFESAGVTAADAMKAINDELNNGDTAINVMTGLNQTMLATEEGFKHGEEAADRLADAERRLADTSRNAARETGKQADKLRDFFNEAKKAPKEIKVGVRADLSPFNRDIRNAMNQRRTVNITAQLTRGRLIE